MHAQSADDLIGLPSTAREKCSVGEQQSLTVVAAGEN